MFFRALITFGDMAILAVFEFLMYMLTKQMYMLMKQNKQYCSLIIKGAGEVLDLGMVKIEFCADFDRAECNLSDNCYGIKKTQTIIP